MSKSLVITLTCLFFCWQLISFDSQAQGVLDTNPASVKWRQMKTPGFKIIYPEGFEDDANDMANTLESIREPETKTMGKNLPKRIPIVLQTQNSISNGFVSLAPRRSEFYTLPPQNYNFIGSNKWLDLLAVHEYRHIAQFNRSRTGITKFFAFLFGGNTQAGVAFMAAPRWFWEGDATLIETAATKSGRGRIPEWDRVFRSNLIDGKRFNYHKQHLRSFKDFVPDHYRLGYYLTGHIRKRTKNPEIFHEISGSAFQLPIIPFTFSNAMKKHSGKNLIENYEGMMDDLQKQWNEEISKVPLTAFSVHNQRTDKTFTDYAYPQVLEDGSVVAFKSGLSDVGQLVRFDGEGNEEKTFISGIMNNTGMLSSTQFKVYWNEYEFDPRWRIKTYSVIKSYDFESKEIKRITKKSRYAGAGISPDGYQLVTVLNTEENENYLVILDAMSGNELKRISTDAKAEYAMPTWSSDGEYIVALKITEEGKSVIRINVEQDEEQTLIPVSSENIGNPILIDSYLLYSSPFNGIDNIYVLDLESGERFQITTSKFGAYSPTLSHDRSELLYADHTVNGLNIVKTPFSKSLWIPIRDVIDQNIHFIDEIVEQEQLEDVLESKPSEKYDSKKYSRLGHMFNIHSWGPFLDADINALQFGVFSKDVLSTTRTSLNYTYDVTEETGFASASISYQGWYPIVEVNYEFGSRRTSSYKWEENTIRTGLRLPLLLTKSKLITNLSISNYVGLRDISKFRRTGSDLGREFFGEVNLVDENDNVVDTISVFRVDAAELDDGQLVFNDFSISYSSLQKITTRNLQSKWGYFLVFQQLNAIGGDFDGRTTGLRGGAFLPSPINLFKPTIFKNHSLNFRFGFQQRQLVEDVNTYAFRNVIFKPRGYSYPSEQSFSSILSNYEFPLLYPDIALGPFLNIKRIRANLFFDFGTETVNRLLFTAEQFNNFQPNDLIDNEIVNSIYTSYGAELTVDFNLFRFPIDIAAGVRVVNTQSNVWNDGGLAVELLFAGVNF